MLFGGGRALVSRFCPRAAPAFSPDKPPRRREEGKKEGFVHVQIRNMAPEAACVVSAKTATTVRRRSTGFRKRSRKPTPDWSRVSAAMAFSISASSSATDQPRAGRSHASAFSAWAYWPRAASQRGLSGTKKRATRRMPGMICTTPSGMM